MELDNDKEDDNDRKPKTNIKGRWDETLKKSYRLSSLISTLAEGFQKKYFRNKYNLDIIEIEDKLNLEEQYINYYFLPNDTNVIAEKIIYCCKRYNLHPDDVGILAFTIDFLCELDKKYRDVSHENTKTSIETIEIREFLKKANTDETTNTVNSKKLEMDIERVRKNKRWNFYMHPGMVKMSTIHSFKGWEIKALFLIIENSENISDELIYTALTRCKRNLFIINIGNKKYDEYFKENIN
ncbi:hypothetical protein BH10BAC5_BH10BAC5_21260 [soil metagenome]